MPLLPIAYAPILTGLTLIFYGILVEKWFVSKFSAFMNGIAIVVALTTLQFIPFQATAILLVYAILMIFLAVFGGSDLLWLTGSRVTGGLLLGLGLADSGILANPSDFTSILILSVSLAILSYVLGWIYSKFHG